MTSQPTPATSTAWKKLAISAAALVLPALLFSIVIPGLDLERLRILTANERFPATCTLGALLLVPWLTASTLVASTSGLWRLVRGKGFERKRRLTAEWVLGALLTSVQVTGLTLFFSTGDYLINEPWARFGVALSLGLGSLLTRVMVSIVSRFGLGEGWSVMLAAELTARLAESLAERREALTELVRAQTSLNLPIALLSALALSALLANLLPLKLAKAPWATFPIMPTASLAALNLALTVQLALIDTVKLVGGAGSLLSLPLNPLVPPDEVVALALVGAFTVGLAALQHKRTMQSCAVAGLSPVAAQRWFWASTFVTACWLLLLTHAANLSTLGKDMVSIVVVLFVVRDLWRSFQLHVRTQQPVRAATFGDASEAHAAAFVLARERIEHVIEGAGLHSLFRDFVSFADLTLICDRADVERVQRSLASLTGSVEGASPETR